jgi:hypothetical protein
VRARDAGLRRVSVVTRVVVVGSVSAAGLFSALAAWAQPGRAKTVSTNGAGIGAPATPVTVPASNAPVSTPATSPPTAAPDDGAEGGDSLSPPAAPPDPGYQSSGPAVVSGAS